MRSIPTPWLAAAGTIIAVAFVSLLIALPQTSESAFPGLNGVIAYHGTLDSSAEIFTINADGTSRHQLTDAPGEDANASWSADGSQILFDSERDGGGFQNSDVFVMNASGTGQTRLKTGPLPDDWNPVFSPDGQKIAFQSFRDGNDEIYVADEDGTNAMNLTGNVFSDRDPSWSPDGSLIVFTSNRDGNDDIYVMNADGSVPTNVSNDTADDDSPNWSPDGSRITFQSDRDGDPDIWVMNADGGGPKRLTVSLAIDTAPAWSPDGTRIAFQSDREGSFDIFAMNADGTSNFRVTFGPVHGQAPDWQPNQTPPTATPVPTASPTPTLAPGQSRWGDDDCDADVDSVDGLKNLQEVAGLPYSQTDPCFELGDVVGVATASGIQIAWGDVDCDGDVDSVDALGILRSVAALPVVQQQPCPVLGSAVVVTS